LWDIQRVCEAVHFPGRSFNVIWLRAEFPPLSKIMVENVSQPDLYEGSYGAVFDFQSNLPSREVRDFLNTASLSLQCKKVK
jgi:hypothetical protein